MPLHLRTNNHLKAFKIPVMKKALLSLTLLAAVVAGSFSFQSCNKIKDEIAKHLDPFNASPSTVTFTIPVVAGDNFSQYDSSVVNIDQIIHDNAGMDFSINNISEIDLSKITISLTDADEQNNWTNFSDATVLLSTDKSNAAGKTALVAMASIPDQESAKYADQVLTATNPINLKDYFNGGNTTVYYLISANARRNTTHELTATMTIEYTLKP
jgi:hypothetical protein